MDFRYFVTKIIDLVLLKTVQAFVEIISCHCYFSFPVTNILLFVNVTFDLITYFCLLIFFLFFSLLSFLCVSSWKDFDMYHELNFSLLMILFGVSF